jgi:hypothetical protein
MGRAYGRGARAGVPRARSGWATPRPGLGHGLVRLPTARSRMLLIEIKSRIEN